ncbi:hypothetical protein LSH36_1137g00085 [Paralvinella palmiformis]|uniref:Sulfatase N-terminal domain-containing protein n=1 Tax=Paralvinella palmiformis TaxID=53620 RepID=A0AAD9IVB3_9ANNE|nr:hypothetical protein LSH36_1137g00085 [Paralvinella palmiformis]
MIDHIKSEIQCLRDDIGTVAELFLCIQLLSNNDIKDDIRIRNAVKTNEATTGHENMETMNVLFLVSDDIRPQMNCFKGRYYPNPRSNLQMHTPNIDYLARKSIVFTQAYVQYAVCGPSRSSYMTGRRPDKTQIWNLKTYWRETGGNFTTLPQYFKEHGYITAAVGKIYHPGNSSNDQDPPSWTIPYQPIENYYNTKESWKAVPRSTRKGQHFLVDEEVANATKALLRTFAANAKTKKQHFFIAAGFYKPHMPLVCGEEFFEHYELNQVDLPEYGYLTQGYPESAYYPSDEFMGRPDLAKYNFTGAMNETFPDEVIRMLRRAYFACVSQVDSLLGDVLRELENLGLADSTIISFIGDHGFHLGENGLWGKHTNFHYSTRAPMMIRIPGRTDKGIRSDSLVEFVDIYSTIVEAAGLGTITTCPRDSSMIRVCSDGKSLLPLIDNPYETHKDAVFSQLRAFKDINGMHYSIRTDRYLYSEVVPFNRTPNEDGSYRYDILWEASAAVQLYDLTRDPDERINIVDNRQNLHTRATLSRQLHKSIESFASLDNVKVLI